MRNKLLLYITIVISSVQVLSAQDLNSLISDLSEKENVQYQIVDKATIEMSLQATPDAPDLSSFMNRVEQVEVIELTQCNTEEKDLFLKDFDSLKDKDGYQILIDMEDDTDKIVIVAKKEGTLIPEIIILVKDNETKEMAIVKMIGKLTESDIPIIIEQNKK